MLTIVIFFVFLIVTGVAYCRDGKYEILIFCALAFIIGTSALITIPFLGYHQEPVIEETSLLPIAKGEETDYYLINAEENSYIFRVAESISQYDTIDSELKILKDTNIEYFETENTERGVLKKYTLIPKRNLFTLAWGVELTDYVIIVPKGSVIK